MLKNILLLFLFGVFSLMTGGCVSPNSTGMQASVDAEAQKHPERAEEIRQNYKEWEIKQRNAPAGNNTYSITENVASKGSSKDLVLYQGDKEYFHKINLKLVCAKDEFLPKPYSRKNIRWTLTEGLSGDAQSSSDGTVKIIAKAKTTQPFKTLTLKTSKKTYEVNLSEFPTVDLDSSECL